MLKRVLNFCAKHDVFFHTAISATIVLVLGLLGVNVWLSAWIAMAVGFAKEWADHFRGGYGDGKDLLCDAIGTIAGTIICLMIN